MSLESRRASHAAASISGRSELPGRRATHPTGGRPSRMWLRQHEPRKLVRSMVAAPDIISEADVDTALQNLSTLIPKDTATPSSPSGSQHSTHSRQNGETRHAGAAEQDHPPSEQRYAWTATHSNGRPAPQTLHTRSQPPARRRKQDSTHSASHTARHTAAVQSDDKVPRGKGSKRATAQSDSQPATRQATAAVNIPGQPQHMDPRSLTSAIKSTNTLDELSALLQQYSDVMNHIHVTALLVQLNHLAQQLGLVQVISSDTSGIDPLTDLLDIESDEEFQDGSGQQQQQAAGSRRQHQRRGRNTQRVGHRRGRSREQQQAGLQRQQQQQVQKVLQRVVRLLQQRLMDLDGRGLVTVLYCLAKLQYRHSIAEDLLYLSISHLEEYDPQGFSNIIYAAAVLRVRPRWDWMKSFYHHSLRRLPDFPPQALSNTLWALAKLHRAPGVSTGSRQWEVEMYQAVGRAAQSGTCKPQALANLCWALGRMDLFPPAHVSEALALAVAEQWGSFTPQGLSTAAWGLSRLRAHVSRQWWQEFMTVTYPMLPTMQPMALSTILLAMSQLSHNPTDTQPLLSDTAITRPTTAVQPQTTSPRIHAGMPSHPDAHAGTPERSRGAAAQGASAGTDTAESAESEQHGLGDAWVAQLQQRLVESMEQSNAQVVSVLLYSFGRLRLQPQPPLLQALLARSMQILPTFTPQGLANMLWGLSKLGWTPDPDWMSQFMEESYNTLPLMNQQELSTLIRALASMRCWPDQLWMTRYDQCCQAQMSEYEPESLSLSIRALAVMRYTPSLEWQRQFTKQLQVQLLKLVPMQIADIIWAVAELGLNLPGPVLQRMIHDLTQDITVLGAETMATALYAMAKLRLRVPPVLVELFLIEIESEMEVLSVETLAGTAWALAALAYQPEERVLRSLDRAVLKHIGTLLSAAAGSMQPQHMQQRSKVVVAQGSSRQGQSSWGRQTLDVTIQMEAVCRLAAARPQLGPASSPALSRALLQLLSRPEVLRGVTAPQLLLALRGLVAGGHVGSSEDVLQLLSAGAMQQVPPLFKGPATP